MDFSVLSSKLKRLIHLDNWPPAGSRPFGQGGPQKSLPAKRTAAAKSTNSGKGSGRGRSGGKGDDEGEGSDGEGNTQKKTKKQKGDPKLAARLQKLDVEKTVLLTSNKWTEKVKALNLEVSALLRAAEQFPQTKGFPGYPVSCFLFWWHRM